MEREEREREFEEQMQTADEQDVHYQKSWDWYSCQPTEDEINQLFDEAADVQQLCCHGNPPHECNACMVLGDIAFDADREDRYFR